MEKVRVRFAPSPTGFLHVGNARTALFNWLYARQRKGAFVLRVEDTDVERSAYEYEKRLLEDLKWLGLDWDEGPDVGGKFGPYRQSQRLEIYKAYTEKLLNEEKAYYCFCSPEELEKERKHALDEGKMPIYSGKCRSIPFSVAVKRLKAGEKAAIRLRTPDEGSIGFYDIVRGNLSFELALIGDPVLVRSNGLPAYNYVVVIDDFLMHITHVIRGEDHISNTPRQILAYQALGFSIPQFAHLSMVMGKDNTRLSKRHGATSIEQFEKEGILASSLFNYLALLGWAPPEGKEILMKEGLLELFDLERVNKASAIFDYGKLYWLNRQHIKKLTCREKAEIAYPFLREANILPEAMTDEHWSWLDEAVNSLLEGTDRFKDLVLEFSIFFDYSLSDMSERARDILKTDCAEQVIKCFGEKIRNIENFDYEKFALLTQEIKEDTGCKGKNLYHPLRVALTVRDSGLELDKFIPLVEAGSKLNFPKPLKNCSQRMNEIIKFLGFS